MANEFRLLESFGAVGDGATDDWAAVRDALVWSGDNKLPVYGFNSYLLAATLNPPANATLIATPTARFIRGFGDATNTGDGGSPLVQTADGPQPNIRIQGGLWNGVPSYDLPNGNAEPWTTSITFTPSPPGTPSLIGFTDAKIKFFHGDGTPRAGILPQLWVYKTLPNGDFDPSAANNNRIFTVVDYDGPNRIKVAESVGSSTVTVTGMTGSYVPYAGKIFDIDSPGGVIDGVGIVSPRGIQFQLRGDGFLLTRSWSRNPPPDGGGGVRFTAGRNMRGTLLDLETIDDGFQFTPTEGAVVEDSLYADSYARVRQGALIVFASGGGRAYEATPSNTLLQNALARNIRGVTGGSPLHGGVAIKVYCANSINPSTNLWVEDVSIRQSDTVPPDTLRAGVMIVTGRPAETGTLGSGILNSGARNLVIENRAGPLIAIGPADGAPAGFSKAVDFTVEQARGSGRGTQKGVPLIAAPYADRLVLRDISGDLSGGVGDNPGRALEIGVSFTYISAGVPVTIPAGVVADLVIENVATGNAGLPALSGSTRQGIWKFGNIGKASVQRLSTTLASTTSRSVGSSLRSPPESPARPTAAFPKSTSRTSSPATRSPRGRPRTATRSSTRCASMTASRRSQSPPAHRSSAPPASRRRSS